MRDKEKLIRADLLLRQLVDKNGHVAAPPHRCPYESDVNNNPDPSFCDCCEECESQCADDI